jgi:hypothetical protein
MPSPFGLWLAYLGVTKAELAAMLGIDRHAVKMAIRRGSRSCAWLRAAAVMLEVPARILVAISPDDPIAAPYRTSALRAAAARRLEYAKRVPQREPVGQLYLVATE